MSATVLNSRVRLSSALTFCSLAIAGLTFCGLLNADSLVRGQPSRVLLNSVP